MAAIRETVLFDVSDYKVYPLLTDSVSASPTYGAAIDVPGINKVSVDPNLITAELAGDAKVIAKRGKTDRIKVSALYGKLSLNVLVAIMGGAVTDSGTGSTEEATYDLLASAASLPYFKSEFKVDDLDTGLATVHCVLPKCQLTGAKLIDQAYTNFGQPSFDLEAIPPEFATTPMIRLRFLEAATNLSA
jgi:hypothetical protein